MFSVAKVSSKINDPFEKDGLDHNVLHIIILPVGAGALGRFMQQHLLIGVMGK